MNIPFVGLLGALCLVSACADSGQSGRAAPKTLSNTELAQLHAVPLTMRGTTPSGNSFTIRRYRDGSQHMDWANAVVSGGDSGSYEVRGDELCSRWTRGGGSECARIVQTGPDSYQTIVKGSVTSSYTVGR